MPLLDRAGWRDDPYRRIEDGVLAGFERVLVPWNALGEALPRRQPGQRLGVEVANDLAAVELLPLLPELALIAVVFPVHADGRGFSLARRLRREGFGGRLRARGPLIADQFAAALACGFDEIELDEAVAARQPLEQWLHAAAAFGHGYQRGYGETASILDLRRAARRQEVSDVR